MFPIKRFPNRCHVQAGRADGVKAAIFRQRMDGTVWRDDKVDMEAAKKLEDATKNLDNH